MCGCVDLGHCGMRDKWKEWKCGIVAQWRCGIVAQWRGIVEEWQWHAQSKRPY
jgi:hypothetical protein